MFSTPVAHKIHLVRFQTLISLTLLKFVYLLSFFFSFYSLCNSFLISFPFVHHKGYFRRGLKTIIYSSLSFLFSEDFVTEQNCKRIKDEKVKLSLCLTN
jgi:hypothetical protein